MSARPDLAARLRMLDIAKFLRYSGVSVVNVLLGLITFNLCRAMFGMSWVTANIVSVAIGALPAYFMSRAWVWKLDGKISMATEVIPFWGINFVGFVASSVTVAVVDHWTLNSLVVNTARMAAWGVVWVFKYLVLDKYLFAPSPRREPEPVIVGR
jgi:putative flippase GtrA